MQLTPDDTTLLRVFGIGLNATIVNTWIIMALLTGVSALVTRKLRADVPPNRWRTALEVTVSGILSQIAEVTGRHDPHALLRRHAVSVHRDSQHPDRRARFRNADRVALNHGGAGDFGAGGRPDLRDRQPGSRRLSAHLYRAVDHHAAFQPDQRGVARHLAGHSPLRQHHVGCGNRRHPAVHRTIFLSGRHGHAGAADRHHPGLHLRHPCDGLHLIGHRRATRETIQKEEDTP